MFANPELRDYYCCRSTLFQRDKYHARSILPLTLDERQLSARLHCLYGVPILRKGACSGSHCSITYPIACSRVYDLRNYTANTHWEPFMDDSSLNVDWEKVEAVMVVIGYNLREYRNYRGQDVPTSVWTELEEW
jgi:hypothetical protein